MVTNTSSHSGEGPKSQLASDITAIGVALRAVVSGLRPKDVPLPFAPEVLAAFADVQRVAESGRVLMTARAAQAREWERQGYASAADWLAAQQGTTTGRARADLETSGHLDNLEATADAVRAGRLSPEEAGAVADAAAANPGAEDDLLDLAQRESLKRTRQEAERRKAEVRSEDEKRQREERVRKDRSLRFWYGNGAGNLHATGPIDVLKELEALIQREVDRKFRANRDAASRESLDNYAFDALIDLARTAGGGATGLATRPRTVRDRRSSARFGRRRARRAPLTRLTLIRVDLAALLRGSVAHGEVCEIGGIAVSVTELRRLLGESIMQLVLTNGEAVIDVVNLGRKPTVAQMIAKLFADACCTAQGCDRAVRLEFDHRTDWARVKVTELANLDLLCDHHHDLKTLEKWALVPGTGRRPMVPPTDRRHPNRRLTGGDT
ncbi:MAG: HNH endonuclease signature motif containing protein [Microthrixaceae bacterium]